MTELECWSCDAVFTVDHDLDSEYYRVKHCPFCGSSIEDEEDLEDPLWDDDWEE